MSTIVIIRNEALLLYEAHLYSKYIHKKYSYQETMKVLIMTRAYNENHLKLLVVAMKVKVREGGVREENISFNSALSNVVHLFHFISFHFILLRRVALQQKLVFKRPSIKNIY